jgi:hypothetical protein
MHSLRTPSFRFFPIWLAVTFAVGSSMPAAVVYSGPVTLPIPLNFDGIYLNPFTGSTAGTEPASWATAPWINPFFGGVYIGTNSLFRPAITGADQIVNLPAGTLIGSGLSFSPGQSGSISHLGAGPDQFVLGVPGYIGFAMQSVPAGPTLYGWLKIEIKNTGPGSILGWAYENTPGASIQSGAVPEPTAAFLSLASAAVLTWRRRRVVRNVATRASVPLK